MKKKLLVMMIMLILFTMSIFCLKINLVYAACAHNDVYQNFVSAGSAGHYTLQCGECGSGVGMKTNHEYGSWSKHSRTCRECGYTSSHTPNWKWEQYSDTHHNSICTICGYTSATTHSFSGACSNCGEKLKVFEKIPILSYIIFKGKCKHCNKKTTHKEKK